MRQEFLKSVSLFHEIDDDDLVHMLMVGLVKRYAQGSVILTEGSTGGCLHIIHYGEVRITKRVPGLGEEAL
ncbi:MAG: cyclic nucleotide-binding domain-containing protein, partial [Vicinamibacteria bacterium]|nr:cyclic nucleotide-binding domain-containing protein [Vicinamibacteria bacterium]